MGLAWEKRLPGRIEGIREFECLPDCPNSMSRLRNETDVTNVWKRFSFSKSHFGSVRKHLSILTPIGFRPEKKSVKKIGMLAVKKWNRCYPCIVIFKVGKSYQSPDLFKCCDWFHFRQAFQFLAFFRKPWSFLLLFCIKAKK